MATFIRSLDILLRYHVFSYQSKFRRYTDKLIRIQQSLCPEHLKKDFHSFSIQSRKYLKVKDLVRPASGCIHFSRSMAQKAVDTNKLKSSSEMTEFDALFPELVEELTNNEIMNHEIADAYIRFKEVLFYNVPQGRKMRGVLVVTTYKHLVSGASEADLKIARVLGWCVELLQGCFLIADDIVDNSLNRRGKTFWYRKENIGLTAINDSVFLECCIYSLLRKYIRDKPYYLTMIDLFSQITLQTVTGQCLDLIKAPLEAKVDFSQFTMERYSAIAKWKTAFYSFYLPAAIAMHMAGISDEESHTKAKTILLQMGHFYQVQNDYRDCYGDLEVAGKVGTDIEENKCTWLILKALEIASEEQKEELKGTSDADHLKKKIHSLCIKSRKDLRFEDQARPTCGYMLCSRSMAQHDVDANTMKASREVAKFDALFPEVVEALTKNEIMNPEIADAYIRFKEVLHYNVPNGRKIRGLAVVQTYKHLVPGASEAELKIARVLGWCVELMQAGFVIVDDMLDNSLNRRGKTCWYRKDNVGLTAINDSFFLESCIYTMLRKYIRYQPYYLTIWELFSQIILQTITGQCLEILASPTEAMDDFSLLTMDKYSTIAKWKTSSYTFYFPVAIAMHMAGISDEESHTKVKTIAFQIGHFYQVQNDYHDCYGDVEVTGKVGSDIEENKCTWLLLKALEIASDEQKEELKLNYGKNDKEAVEKVKAIYKDLNLEDIYRQYEESSYQEITNLINSADTVVPKEVFLDFANKIYNEKAYFLNVDR